MAGSCLRSDGQSLSSAVGNPRRQPGGGDEMAARNLHAALQPPAPGFRAICSKGVTKRWWWRPGRRIYLQVVSTYIHLNPARAGLIEIGRERLKRYRWSSYPWYLNGAGQAAEWLCRERVMGSLGLAAGGQRIRSVYRKPGAGVGEQGRAQGAGGAMAGVAAGLVCGEEGLCGEATGTHGAGGARAAQGIAQRRGQRGA